MTNGKILAIDSGNSSIKMGIIDPTTISCCGHTRIDISCRTDQLSEEISRLLTTGDLPMVHAHIAAVAQREKIMGVAQKHPAISSCHAVHFHPSLPLDLNYDEPTRLGADRLAFMLYGKKRFPHSGFIAVSIGTAITIDCVSAAGKFLGGAILPGIQTQLDSLAQGTEQLPQLGTMPSPPCAGHSTESCILYGVHYGCAAAVDGIITHMQKNASEALDTILLCGGGAPLITPLLRSRTIYEPHAILIGAALYTPET